MATNVNGIKKITDLSPVSSIADTDSFMIETSSGSKKVTGATLKAETGVQTVTVSGTDPVITAVDNTRYVCGEVTSLSFTPCASGICDVIFTSGSTVAVLTINGLVRWANGFDSENLDADTTYEINIMDGLGVAASWT